MGLEQETSQTLGGVNYLTPSTSFNYSERQRRCAIKNAGAAIIDLGLDDKVSIYSVDRPKPAPAELSGAPGSQANACGAAIADDLDSFGVLPAELLVPVNLRSMLNTPPPNPIIRMGVDPNCLKMNSGARVVQDVVERSSDGGLANAFVHVQGPFSNAPSGSGSVRLDKKGRMYHPRILGAAVGQTLIIRNDDSALHNIRTWATHVEIAQASR
jgi:hypothetical protein